MVRQQIRNSAFEYEKMGKLFDLVTRYDERAEDFYAKKLYNKAPDNTFRVTKSRLKRMLENVLLNDKSLAAYDTEFINAKLQAQKKLMQGEILLGRGAYEASKNLLLQVIATAKKYQLYDELFRAELLLYRKDGIRSSVKEFEKRTQALHSNNQSNALIHEGLILHYSISNLLLNRTTEMGQFSSLRKKIDRIKTISEQSSHPLVKQIYYLSENYYYQAQGNYQLALDYCQQYFDLLQKEKSLYSKQKEASAYVQLAEISMMLNRLSNAEEFANKALNIYSPEEMNYLVSLQLAFRIAFFAKRYLEAQDYIEKAFSHPLFEISVPLAARWHYYDACLLFRQKKFQEAYHKLNDTTPLLADKSGMNLYIRLLEIMIMYELGHYDLMETKILNMRQFVKRTQEKQRYHRANDLVRILINWYKNNYDFPKAWEALKKESENEITEEQLNFNRFPNKEFIRLEEWIAEKIEKY